MLQVHFDQCNLTLLCHYNTSVENLNVEKAIDTIVSIRLCQNVPVPDICNQINHQETWALAAAERSLLSYLDASCRTPLSAYAIFDGDVIKAHYMISDITGENIKCHHEVGDMSTASEMGVKAAIALVNIMK